MIFDQAERRYLLAASTGRLATADTGGVPQVRPVGFRLNDDDTIDIGGPNPTVTRRYRNVRGNPAVAFVVDDLPAPGDPDAVKPGMGRGVEIRGDAEIVTVEVPPVNPRWFSHDVIRIHPRKVLSWHIDPDEVDGSTRTVG